MAGGSIPHNVGLSMGLECPHGLVAATLSVSDPKKSKVELGLGSHTLLFLQYLTGYRDHLSSLQEETAM